MVRHVAFGRHENPLFFKNLDNEQCDGLITFLACIRITGAAEIYSVPCDERGGGCIENAEGRRT